MACRDERVTIYLNGIECKKDSGCAGAIHTYTTTTTLHNPTYKWSIDGVSPPKPLLGTSSTFKYTFDDKDHLIYLVVTGESGSECAIEKTILVKGKQCGFECDNQCKFETVDIPSGIVNYLSSNFGNTYSFPRGYSFECVPKISAINDATCLWLQTYLKALPNCSEAPISVTWFYNLNQRNCIKLTIKNSPVKFTKIMIDGTIYNFDITHC